MNQLIIDNHIIKQDIKSILSLVKFQIIGEKLKDIKCTGDEVAITCPFHKEGKEQQPSCFIYVGEDEKIPWGTFHCFTCGEKGGLIKFIAKCFDRNYSFAKEWLKQYFTEKVVAENSPLALGIEDEISFKKLTSTNNTNYKQYLSEEILNKFQSWHPYMAKRNISIEIANRFQVSYDTSTKTIVFPVRDKYGNLVFLTRRSVEGKKFYIDANASKIVYLLNEAIKNNYKQVIVVESQINALVSYSYGFPAVALFGAGTTEEQINELNSTSIIHYILMYDNDEAGRKGASKFKKLIKKDVFITDILMPKGKDVADCSKEEFWNILRQNDVEMQN